MNPPQGDEPIQQQALHWFVRSRASDFSAAERTQLAHWLAADARHRQEFEQLSGTWRDLDRLAPRLTRLRTPPAQRARRRLLEGALAFSLLAGTGMYFWQTAQSAPRHLESARGQHLQVSLASGAQLWLDADSAIDLTESRPAHIVLRRGGLYLQVEHGDGLIVEAAGASLRDIGTRFAVHLRGDQASVAVAEGRVEVTTASASQQVGAGRRLNFNAQALLAEQAIASEAVGAWRQGRWHFSATPLAELADELKRQQNLRLDFSEPGLGRLTVSGDFEMRHPEQVLWAVAQVHGLNLQHLGGRAYRLSSR